MTTHLAVDQPNVHLELDLEDDDPLGQVRAFKGLEGEMKERTFIAVGQACVAGHSWEEIGTALGVSRQAAWEMYSEWGHKLIEEGRRNSGMTEEEAMQLAIDEIKAYRQEKRQQKQSSV